MILIMLFITLENERSNEFVQLLGNKGFLLMNLEVAQSTEVNTTRALTSLNTA